MLKEEEEEDYSAEIKDEPCADSGRLHQILAWLFGGDIDGAARRPRSSGVIRPHQNVIRGAAFHTADDSRCLISHSPLHTGHILFLTSTPVPELKGTRAERVR